MRDMSNSIRVPSLHGRSPKGHCEHSAENVQAFSRFDIVPRPGGLRVLKSLQGREFVEGDVVSSPSRAAAG